VLAWGSSFDGSAVRITREYWWWVAPVAVPVLILIAWRLQRALIGSSYKPRGATKERVMGLAESWMTGTVAATILVALATFAFANVMNQMIGVAYVATYDVAAKYVQRGKHTCYALILTKVGDASDEFRVCVSRPEQDQTAIGEVMTVSGRRSRFVNQLLAYTRTH